MSLSSGYLTNYKFLMLCVFTISNACHAYDIHDVADPPAALVTYVGDVIQNGLPIQMKQFSTEASVTELLAFYKQRWSDASNQHENVPSYLEKQAGDWYVLSKMEGNNSVVVQARKANQGMTEGYISVTDMSDIREQNHWSSDFPRMHGTKILSNTEALDKGRVAYTLVLYNEHSVRENRDYYRDNMSSSGWQYTRGGERSKTTMLYFKNETLRCEIAISSADDGKTIIFANLVDINENS